MLKRISSRYAQVVTEPDTLIAKHNRANREGDGTVENRNQSMRAKGMSRGTRQSGRPTRLSNERLDNADSHRHRRHTT